MQIINIFAIVKMIICENFDNAKKKRTSRRSREIASATRKISENTVAHAKKYNYYDVASSVDAASDRRRRVYGRV